jgi:hypothetical protein
MDVCFRVEDQIATDLTLLTRSPPRAQLCLGLRHSVASPTTAATAPPMSVQTALSVGDPVKNRETSELNELVALMPRTRKTMPPTSSAQEMVLFIMFFSQLIKLDANTCSRSRCEDASGSSAPGNEIDQHHDQRNRQQDMDYASHRVTGYQTEQPENDQDYRDCV